MTCPICGEPLTFDPQACELLCAECSLNAARTAYQRAVDEMYATLADGPERTDWNQLDTEPPF